MKKTIEVFVHQRLAGFMKGDLRVTDFDLTTICNGADAVRLIAVREVEIDIPDDDLDLLEIEALEAEQFDLHDKLAASGTPDDVRAAAGRRLREVEDVLSAREAAWGTAGQRRDDLAKQIEG